MIEKILTAKKTYFKIITNVCSFLNCLIKKIDNLNIY